VDLTFVEGIGAVVSGIIIFCGSVWFLLSMVLGPRLAYFITASISLAILLIMTVVWSISPLGPVGVLPAWEEVAIGAEASDIDFAPATQYPDDPWVAPDQEDEAQLAEASSRSLARRVSPPLPS
jgi:hypothetical protein